MSKYIFFAVIVVFNASCLTRNSAGKLCYRKTKTVVSAYSMGKIADNHLKLKKGNYFVLYERILGLTKAGEIRGQYYQRNDTLLLTFCNDSMLNIYSGKAFIDKTKNEIIVFEKDSIYNQHFRISIDKRKK